MKQKDAQSHSQPFSYLTSHCFINYVRIWRGVQGDSKRPFSNSWSMHWRHAQVSKDSAYFRRQNACIHSYVYACVYVYILCIYTSVVSASARESAIDFSGARVYIAHLYMHLRLARQQKSQQ
jgi:hypothetical protein